MYHWDLLLQEQGTGSNVPFCWTNNLEITFIGFHVCFLWHYVPCSEFASEVLSYY